MEKSYLYKNSYAFRNDHIKWPAVKKSIGTRLLMNQQPRIAQNVSSKPTEVTKHCFIKEKTEDKNKDKIYTQVSEECKWRHFSSHLSLWYSKWHRKISTKRWLCWVLVLFQWQDDDKIVTLSSFFVCFWRRVVFKK